VLACWRVCFLFVLAWVCIRACMCVFVLARVCIRACLCVVKACVHTNMYTCAHVCITECTLSIYLCVLSVR